MENKPASLLVVPLEGLFCRWEDLTGFPHLGEVDRWPTTPKRACYSAVIAFS